MYRKTLYLTVLVSLMAALVFAGPAAAEDETPVDPTATSEVTVTEVVATEEAPATETATPEPAPIDEGEALSVETQSLTVDTLAATPPPIFVVKKDATGTITTTWRWTIDKTASASSLVLSPGQTHTLNYTVTVSAVQDTSWTVSGRIRVANRLEAPVEVTGVSDVLSNGQAVDVECPVTFPYVLAVGVGITCTYSGSGTGTPPLSNTATATLSDGQTFSDTVAIAYGEAVVTDECVEVVDTLGGVLGTVCANDLASTFTFSYPIDIGPYSTCGSYTVDNTATFTTNDSGANGSDTWSVGIEVPCSGGCSLTPGYWKTHSSYGPAPYDDTWALIGEGTIFFLSGQTWYQVLWTSSSGGNAYYILAHAYIAAVLNQLNGADTSAVTSQLAEAAAFFSAYSPTSTLSRSLRASILNTASVLDQYNNGLIGPGHCTQ